MRKRNHTVAFRMNDEEYKNFQKKLKESGQTSQTFLLRAVEGAEILPAEEVNALCRISASLSEHNRQVRGIATNINQMAHVANVTGMTESERTLKELSETIYSYRKEGEAIWQSIRQLIAGQRAMGH